MNFVLLIFRSMREVKTVAAAAQSSQSSSVSYANILPELKRILSTARSVEFAGKFLMVFSA